MPGRAGLKIHAECCASLPTACPAQPWLVGLACIPHRQLSLQLLVCWPPLLTCLVALHSDTPHCPPLWPPCSARFMCRYFSGFFWRHPLLDGFDLYW